MDNIDTMEEIIQLVSFRIANEEFGIDIVKVQEIIRMMEITRVPNTPNYIEGVVNLRGKVTPVVNLRTKLGLPTNEKDEDTRIVVVNLEDKTIGFIVDEVKEVLRINSNITEEPPKMVGGISEEYIISIAKMDDRLLILLDLETLIKK